MMLFKYLLLTLIPALTYGSGGINIKIKVEKDVQHASVDFTGADVAIISDEERKSFQLTDRALKKASGIFSGRECTDIYLKRPTPWEDVYKKFGWYEVKRTLKPIRGRVVAINARPTAVATAEYMNKHSAVTAKYTTNVQQTVEETVSNTWKKGGEFTVGQEISYGVTIGDANVGGKTSFSYTSSWGNDTTQSRKVTLGTTSSVEVDIPPGGGVLATLSATRGTIDIEVDYEATVDGQVFCNHHGKYKGHMWWAYPLSALQEDGDLPRALYSTEKISIGFYTDVQIVVSNLKTHVPVRNVLAGVIDVVKGF